MRDYNLVLDVQKEENVSEEIWFIQGDIGNKITFTLLDDGVPVDLAGKAVLGYFENREGVISQKNFTAVDTAKGICEVEVTNSITSIVGNINVEVKIYEGSLRTSFTPFQIVSKKSINTDDAIESSQEIDVIQIGRAHV